MSYDQVVGRVNTSKCGNATTNFGSADPPLRSDIFSRHGLCDETAYAHLSRLRTVQYGLSNVAVHPACGARVDRLLLKAENDGPALFKPHHGAISRAFPPVDQCFPMLAGLLDPMKRIAFARCLFAKWQGLGYGLIPDGTWLSFFGIARLFDGTCKWVAHLL